MHVIPQYFLVRIPKDEQAYKRHNEGSLFIHPNLVFFARNTQCGEIISIGSEAQRNFPESKIGHIAIMHHFVEGSLDKRNARTSLINEDKDFKYYLVSGVEWPGTRVQIYGVWDGTKIISHKDYIFLKKEQPTEEVLEHEFLMMPQYVESTERTLSSLGKIKSVNLKMSKNKMTDELRASIDKKDYQREKITANFHKKEYQRYSVVSASYFNLKEDDEVYALNVAANTIVDFLGVSYRVIERKYLSMF